MTFKLSLTKQIARFSSPIFRESGAALVFFSICLFVLVGFIALSLDIGRAYAEQRRLQFAADAASMAAVMHLSDGAAKVRSVANALLVANGFSPDDAKVNCVFWNTESKLFPPQGEDCSSANAVHVEAHRQTPMTFAKIFGPEFLNLVRPAVALKSSNEPMSCIRPFAILDELIQSRAADNTFWVPWSGGGNWGKIEIPSYGETQYTGECDPGPPLNNPNSTPGEFFDSLMKGICNPAIEIGDGVVEVNSEPGNAGTGQDAFDALLACGLNQKLFVATTDGFPNGRGPMNIISFAEITFLESKRVQGKTHLKFHLDNYGIQPEIQDAGGGEGRALVF